MAIGCSRGAASPCCFFHKDKDVAIVVHGDDFTALGEAADLEWYEKGLASFFQLKVRGRLGPEASDDKEVRILNRIVRVVPSGLCYEADPRHVEILVKSLGVENAKSVASPGVKDYAEVEDDSDEASGNTNDSIISVLQELSERETDRHGRPWRIIRFKETPAVLEVQPYSEVYGIHPRNFVITRRATFKTVSDKADRFTGKSEPIMQQRLKWFQSNSNQRMRLRENILKKTIENGADWEESTDMRIAMIHAVKSKKKGQKRLGAKKVKEFERLESKGEILNPEEATSYRALAARTNYLALDRPDIAFAAKELCREFAAPTKQSYMKLKRMVRYLKGRPRLVWNFFHQETTDVLYV